MVKSIFSAAVLTLMANICFGQTTKEKLDGVRSNPATTQNAAKADVQLINNKEVTDNSAILRTLREKRKQHRAFRKKILPRRSS
jgi:hypothetical protein